MSSDFIRISGLGLLFIGLAGCGGGSVSGGDGGGGGGGGNPTAVTFKINGGTPTAVAAKIGSGPFTAQTLTSGSLSLSIPSGTTTFALAVSCAQETETIEQGTVT